jgi:hypothetical protein
LQGEFTGKQRKWRKKARFVAENLTLDQSLARQFRWLRNSGIKSAEQRNFSAEIGKISGIASPGGKLAGVAFPVWTLADRGPHHPTRQGVEKAQRTLL